MVPACEAFRHGAKAVACGQRRNAATKVWTRSAGRGQPMVPLSSLGTRHTPIAVNPHASPLGTLQPPRHTWCVCNALGKARPGALSRLSSNRHSAGSRASSVIGRRQSSSVRKSPRRTTARTIPSMKNTNGLASSNRTVLTKRFTVRQSSLKHRSICFSRSSSS